MKTRFLNNESNSYKVGLIMILMKAKKSERVSLKIYFNHPALRITARDKNKIRHAQVALFRVDSALLALVNIELPLDARPPIPSPFGL